jgi:hypothetical protein
MEAEVLLGLRTRLGERQDGAGQPALLVPLLELVVRGEEAVEVLVQQHLMPTLRPGSLDQLAEQVRARPIQQLADIPGQLRVLRGGFHGAVCLCSCCTAVCFTALTLPIFPAFNISPGRPGS